MQRPTILIGGGYDKGSEFDLYVKAFKDKVKLLVLIGQTSEKIAATAKKYGFDSIIYADSMEEVVKICAQNAKPGDAVFFLLHVQAGECLIIMNSVEECLKIM